MNISQWKNGDRTFFSLEVNDRLLLLQASVFPPSIRTRWVWRGAASSRCPWWTCSLPWSRAWCWWCRSSWHPQKHQQWVCWTPTWDLLNPPDITFKFELIWFFSITNYEVNNIRVAIMQIFCLFPVLQLPRCRLDPVTRATPRHWTGWFFCFLAWPKASFCGATTATLATRIWRWRNVSKVW